MVPVKLIIQTPEKSISSRLSLNNLQELLKKFKKKNTQIFTHHFEMGEKSTLWI